MLSTGTLVNLSGAYDLKANDVLVIGYDVAHPPPVTAQERRLLQAKGISVDSLDPSVVGVCYVYISTYTKICFRYRQI